MGTGVSVLHFKEGTAPAHLPALKGLFDAFIGNAPGSVIVKVPGSGLTVANDGTVTGTWTGVAQAPSQSSVGGGFAAGVGMRIRWYSDVVMNGHKVRGSTFLAPLAGSAYQTDGTIADATINAMATAINTFLTSCAGDFGVWTRPRVAGGGGGWSSVNSGLVPDRVSWLKSRRT